jgi:hypothetical protein
MVKAANESTYYIKQKPPIGEVLHIIYTFSLINLVYELSCSVYSDVREITQMQLGG